MSCFHHQSCTHLKKKLAFLVCVICICLGVLLSRYAPSRGKTCVAQAGHRAGRGDHRHRGANVSTNQPTQRISVGSRWFYNICICFFPVLKAAGAAIQTLKYTILLINCRSALTTTYLRFTARGECSVETITGVEVIHHKWVRWMQRLRP